MINTSNVTFMTPQVLTTLSGLSILQHDEHTYVLPVVTGMYLIKHTNQFFKLEHDLAEINSSDTYTIKQHWYVIGWDTGGKKAIKYAVPGNENHKISKNIDHRKWIRGIPNNFSHTVIENMSEVFPKYFALESRLSDIHPRYQEKVESEFKPRLKEIVAYHG